MEMKLTPIQVNLFFFFLSKPSGKSLIQVRLELLEVARRFLRFVCFSPGVEGPECPSAFLIRGGS